MTPSGRIGALADRLFQCEKEKDRVFGNSGAKLTAWLRKKRQHRVSFAPVGHASQYVLITLDDGDVGDIGATIPPLVASATRWPQRRAVESASGLSTGARQTKPWHTYAAASPPAGRSLSSGIPWSSLPSPTATNTWGR